MQLTEHFSDEEMGVAGCEQRLIDNATHLCQLVLEPLRDHYGVPALIHDGYRDPGHNARVGGKPTSFHLFEDGKAAADISVSGFDCVQVFDWLRLMSHLQFDKVILERNRAGIAATVHIQIDRLNPPRRLAYTGSTGAGKDYLPVPVNP